MLLFLKCNITINIRAIIFTNLCFYISIFIFLLCFVLFNYEFSFSEVEAKQKVTNELNDIKITYEKCKSNYNESEVKLTSLEEAREKTEKSLEKVTLERDKLLVSLKFFLFFHISLFSFNVFGICY